MAVSPKEGKVIVERVNMVKKHVKPRKMGEPGGIIKAEGAMYASKVQIVCPRCGKPTRVGHKLYEDGTKDAFAENAASRFKEDKKWLGLRNITRTTSLKR